MWETTRLNQQGPRHGSDVFLLRLITYKRKSAITKAEQTVVVQTPNVTIILTKKHVMTIGNGQEMKGWG